VSLGIFCRLAVYAVWPSTSDVTAIYFNRQVWCPNCTVLPRLAVLLRTVLCQVSWRLKGLCEQLLQRPARSGCEHATNPSMSQQKNFEQRLSIISMQGSCPRVFVLPVWVMTPAICTLMCNQAESVLLLVLHVHCCRLCAGSGSLWCHCLATSSSSSSSRTASSRRTSSSCRRAQVRPLSLYGIQCCVACVAVDIVAGDALSA
jgi:hypothetical protein